MSSIFCVECDFSFRFISLNFVISFSFVQCSIDFMIVFLVCYLREITRRKFGIILSNGNPIFVYVRPFNLKQFPGNLTSNRFQFIPILDIK